MDREFKIVRFKIVAPLVREVRLALKGDQGARVVIEWPEAH